MRAVLATPIVQEQRRGSARFALSYCRSIHSITQATILQLIQRGHLGLNDKVFEILKLKPLLEDGKEVDERIYEITILDLLEHRGGWDSRRNIEIFSFQEDLVATAYGIKTSANAEQIISYAMGQPLSHPPGTTRAYCNLGYSLLGRVIEEITRQPYEKYVQQNILSPLGIVDMRIGDSQLGRRAAGGRKLQCRQSPSTSILPSEEENGAGTAWQLVAFHHGCR